MYYLKANKTTVNIFRTHWPICMSEPIWEYVLINEQPIAFAFRATSDFMLCICVDHTYCAMDVEASDCCFSSVGDQWFTDNITTMITTETY